MFLTSQSFFPPDQQNSLLLGMVTKQTTSEFVHALCPRAHVQRSGQGKIIPPDSALY